MKRRQFLKWSAIGGAGAVLGSLFFEPTARQWERLYDYYYRQPYLKFSPPAPSVPGESNVFHIGEVPAPTWDTPYHAGLDALLALMAQHDVMLYKMDSRIQWGGPNGLIAPRDVVLLKVNSQWAERGMTSTDVVRGLIQRLIDHPAGFRGEIVVVENGQTQDYLDSPNQNNDESLHHDQSIRKMVESFRTDRVSLYNWRLIGHTAVGEFDEGDDQHGYVLAGNYPINYPKFTTTRGTRISLKRGIWNGHAYADSSLKLINLPVLKAHVIMGMTGALKNYAGVMSRFVGEYKPG